MTTYIVQTASASMPAKVKAPYKRVAILEVEDGVTGVSMISERARGVVRIVQTWERLHARGVDTAYARAMADATATTAALNAARITLVETDAAVA